MEMREEDQPHESIWLNQEALAEHFERISRKHSAGNDMEQIPDEELETNDLTRDLKRG